MRVGVVCVAVAFAVIVAMGSSPARADDAPSGIPYETIDAAHWPSQVTKRTLTLPAGVFEVGAEVGGYFPTVNNFVGPGGPPSVDTVTFAPQLRYGLTPLVTLGVAQVSSESFISSNGSNDTDFEAADWMVEGIFKIFGPRELALHIQLPFHRLESIMVTNGNVITNFSLDFDVWGTIDGRVVFANELASVRFRAGIAGQSVSQGTAQAVPIVLATFLYQTTPTFAIGANAGFAPQDWVLGESTTTDFEIDGLAYYNLSHQFDLTFRASYATAASDQPISSFFALGVGLLYRP
jgi:hypothetical protein